MTVLTPVRPHGGRLVDLLVADERAAELAGRAASWPSWLLTPRQLCDLEMLCCGGFSPLRGFLGRADYENVCQSMRLADGTLWPIPVMLDVPGELVAAAPPGSTLALRGPGGLLLAALHVTEAWQPDLAAEAASVFGSTDQAHPGVRYLLQRTSRWYVSGELEALRLPEHADFRPLRRTPAEVRAEFAARGWRQVVAFQTRNPMHRAHQELTLRAARRAGARLLIHPVVGVTKPGDVDPHTRVRCYRAILRNYPDGQALLSLLPLAMRMAGPREALWHTIIRKNYGATHFIVGRDHAGPGPDASGQPFYPPYGSQELASRHSRELGMEVLTFKRLVYLADNGEYVPEEEAPPGGQVLAISGTQLRQRLAAGATLPAWFTCPEVAAELRRSYPPREGQGITICCAGPPGTVPPATAGPDLAVDRLAGALAAALLERGDRQVTLLNSAVMERFRAGDGPLEIADTAAAGAGFLAAEITRHRGIAVCALRAPDDGMLAGMRQMVEPHGAFIVVRVAAPASDLTTVRADRAGLPVNSRAGRLAGPEDGVLTADLLAHPPPQAACAIIGYLAEAGYLPAGPGMPADAAVLRYPVAATVHNGNDYAHGRVPSRT